VSLRAQRSEDPQSPDDFQGMAGQARHDSIIHPLPFTHLLFLRENRRIPKQSLRKFRSIVENIGRTLLFF
jgi:hypothetical protein